MNYRQLIVCIIIIRDKAGTYININKPKQFKCIIPNICIICIKCIIHNISYILYTCGHIYKPPIICIIYIY
jgi:hypothetical protein